MRRETAVHFRKSQSGDILVDESGGRLTLAGVGDAGPGAAGLQWRGVWDAGESYVALDMVRNRAGLYVCTEGAADGEPGAPGTGESLGTSWTSSQTNPDPEARWITEGTTELVVEDGGDSFTWATGDTRPTAIGVIQLPTDTFDFVGTVTATFPAGLTVSRYGQYVPYGSTGLTSIGVMTSGQEYPLTDESGDFNRIVFIATGTSSSGRGTATLEIEKTSGGIPINVPPASTSWELMVQGV